MIKKEKQVATRASARIRGAEPEPIKRTIELEYELGEVKKKPRLIDSLEPEEQAKVLDMLKSLVPNTKPSKSNVKVETDNDVREQLEQLEIRHPWATIKVVNSRITSAL